MKETRTHGWQCDTGGGKPAEVHPVNDMKSHALGDGLRCWCQPWANENGTIVHNSADGREAYETGARKVH